MDINHNLLHLIKRYIPDFKINNVLLYEQAFTHSSVVEGSIKSNERLEYLGDAVIELIVSDYLFKKYPEKNEGELTVLRSNLVRTETLASFNRFLELSKFLKTEKGVVMSNRLLANTFEAFLGAMYHDSGMDICNKFLIKLINSHKKQTKIDKNYKGKLIEYFQSQKLGNPIFTHIPMGSKFLVFIGMKRDIYNQLPDPLKRKLFKLDVSIKKNNEKRFVGKSRQERLLISQKFEDNILLGDDFALTKKKAEQMACKEVLEILNKF